MDLWSPKEAKPRELFKLLQSGPTGPTGPTAGDDEPGFSILILEAEIEGTRSRDRAESGFQSSDGFENGSHKFTRRGLIDLPGRIAGIIIENRLSRPGVKAHETEKTLKGKPDSLRAQAIRENGSVVVRKRTG